MNDPYAQVSVRILDKEYQIACPAGERTDLLDSAEILNAKMIEIRDSGRIVGLDRIAVMAALNMANDLLHAQARDRILLRPARLHVFLGRGRAGGRDGHARRVLRSHGRAHVDRSSTA